MHGTQSNAQTNPVYIASVTQQSQEILADVLTCHLKASSSAHGAKNITVLTGDPHLGNFWPMEYNTSTSSFSTLLLGSSQHPLSCTDTIYSRWWGEDGDAANLADLSLETEHTRI